MRKLFRVTQYEPANLFSLVNKSIAEANSGKINLTLADIKGYLVIAATEYPVLYSSYAAFYDETTLQVIDTKEGNRLLYEVEVFEMVGTVDVTPEDHELPE
jgi:hypothetical protein